EIEEEKFFGEGEVLLQQAVGEEGSRGIGQHAFVFGEADGLQGGGGERHGTYAAAGSGVADDDLEQVGAEQLIDGVDDAAFAVEVEAEAGESQLGEHDVGLAVELEAQGCG